METVVDFIFLASEITADGDCSQEIKRRLLLGRKAMTNLESILKIRDITLQTKVHLVKSMVFSVVTLQSFYFAFRYLFPISDALEGALSSDLVETDGQASAWNAGNPGSILRLGRPPGEGTGYPFQYSLPGKSHGQRSLAGYRPWDHKESDRTEVT